MTALIADRHGTRTSYVNDKCRCDACRAANLRYQQESTERRRLRLLADPTLAPHGETSTYNNWGCRCDLCVKASSERAHQYEERRKAAGNPRVRRRRTEGPACSVEGCVRVAEARGFCKLHWQRASRNGEAGPAESLKDADLRFWVSVAIDEASGCWNWLKCRDRRGYGQFSDRGRVLAHRWAYERFVGPIPSGLQIDHLCRNTSCVNPDHLEPVTNAENRRRAAAARTHCKHGHEYTPESTYVYQGRRSCRTCRRERQAA